MNIHWSIWLLIGLVVTIVSALQEGLGIFVIVGIVFLTVGIVKWVFSQGKRKEKPLEHVSVRDNQQKFIKCPHCKAWNYPDSSLCHYCGRRIKKSS